MLKMLPLARFWPRNASELEREVAALRNEFLQDRLDAERGTRRLKAVSTAHGIDCVMSCRSPRGNCTCFQVAQAAWPKHPRRRRHASRVWLAGRRTRGLRTHP